MSNNVSTRKTDRQDKVNKTSLCSNAIETGTSLALPNWPYLPLPNLCALLVSQQSDKINEDDFLTMDQNPASDNYGRSTKVSQESLHINTEIGLFFAAKDRRVVLES